MYDFFKKIIHEEVTNLEKGLQVNRQAQGVQF